MTASPLLRRGFTLLEVVVSMGILALIGAITFETIASALDTRDVLEEEDEANQSARVLLLCRGEEDPPEAIPEVDEAVEDAMR